MGGMLSAPPGGKTSRSDSCGLKYLKKSYLSLILEHEDLIPDLARENLFCGRSPIVYLLGLDAQHVGASHQK